MCVCVCVGSLRRLDRPQAAPTQPTVMWLEGEDEDEHFENEEEYEKPWPVEGYGVDGVPRDDWWEEPQPIIDEDYARVLAQYQQARQALNREKLRRGFGSGGVRQLGMEAGQERKGKLFVGCNDSTDKM